jgi:hypothetical protein
MKFEDGALQEQCNQRIKLNLSVEKISVEFHVAVWTHQDGFCVYIPCD